MGLRRQTTSRRRPSMSLPCFAACAALLSAAVVRADAEILPDGGGKRVAVSSPQIKNPVAVRYARAGIPAEAPCRAGEPNIVVILADDLGYGDVGVCNPKSKIPTPHIDHLADGGMLFTDAHAASATCTPSRYGLLTGINPARTGVLNTLLQRGEPIIAQDEPTLGAFLKEQGYETHMIGKWHLGFETGQPEGKRRIPSGPLRGGPLDRGFDSFFGIAASPGDPPLCFLRGREAEVSPDFAQEEVSPSFCREAVGIIHAHAAKKTEQPLFLYYASPLPHRPWVPTADFRGKSGLGDYGDFVMQLDDVVGRIEQALQETGLDKNTLLVFTSDNGPSPAAVETMKGAAHDCAGGFRGMKSDAWEGGHRVPLIAKWPGHIPPGMRSAAMINATDLFATIAEILAVPLPDGAVDSTSFLAVLRDPAVVHPRPSMVTAKHAIRRDNWKLVSAKKQKDAAVLGLTDFGLYDLDQDTAETTDVLAAHRGKADELFTDFRRFAAQRALKQEVEQIGPQTSSSGESRP